MAGLDAGPEARLRLVIAYAMFVAVAVAEVTAPLGPWARPGVPVLLVSDTPTVVKIDDWLFRVDGPTLVYPPRVPATVRDAAGKELLYLEEVGEQETLVGVIGDPPAELANAVAISPRALHAAAWRALDVFDHLLLTLPAGDEPWVDAVYRWVRAGGSLAGPGARAVFAADAGLGAVADRLDELPPRAIPLPGNIRPDLYAEVAQPAAVSPALRSARWVVLGAAVALALHLLLGARGWIGRRTLLSGLALVAVAAGLLGLLRTGFDYTPVARGRIEILYFGGGMERRRVYEIFLPAGPGAATPEGDAGVPILFRNNFVAWWPAAGRGSTLEEGMIRIFLREELRVADPPDPAVGGEAAPEALWRHERPRGGVWRVQVAAPRRAPAADPAEIPVVLRVEAVRQD